MTYEKNLIHKEQLTACLHKKRLGQLDILLVIMSVEANNAKKVITIKTLGRSAGLPELSKWNVSTILKRSKGLAIRLPEGWILSSNGKKHVNNLGVISSLKTLKTVNMATQLKRDLKLIHNVDSKAFLKEAILAFETNLLRSCVVLSWVGAVSLLYDHIMGSRLSQFNTESKRRFPRWKDAIIKDDLSRMQERDFLEIIGSPPLSIIGKNLKLELINTCLQLRNSCGHPNSLKIGVNRVASHLEILIKNIYNQFS